MNNRGRPAGRMTIAEEWRAIADRIEALLPSLDYVERFAPAIVVDAYRAKAARLDARG